MPLISFFISFFTSLITRNAHTRTHTPRTHGCVLHVKTKYHNIAVGNHVVFTFDP